MKSPRAPYVRNFLAIDRQRADDIVSLLQEPVNRSGHAPSTGTDRGNEASGATWRVESWPRHPQLKSQLSG